MKLDIINKPVRKTNWYVITGGPGSGKTTVINLLKERGYRTAMEHARHYLDTQLQNGKTIEEVRKNPGKFQLEILNMQIDQENTLSPDDIVFLDRAIPDTLAYCQFSNIPVDEKLTSALQTVSYKKIFILGLLPLVNDYARNEDAEAQKKIHELLIEIYESLPFPVVHVPVLPAEERVEFILNNL